MALEHSYTKTVLKHLHLPPTQMEQSHPTPPQLPASNILA